ncbi:terminase [Streptomyces lateritius]|uniref:terminase n=1 Tax=Streptomyces lateritius TaxID=67313 RepID=UPI0021AB793A|nr:terminase [Streptomyces lateritius]
MSSLANEKRAGRRYGSATAESPLYGAQRPRIETAPEGAVSTAGDEAIKLAARAGLRLDPWQQHLLRVAMGETAEGDWVAPEVAINLPRQNGKGALIEARVLWGLFIGREKQILLSAHEFKTVLNARDRIEGLIKGCPDLHKRVKAYVRTVGREGVILHDGRELRYIARSSGSGRGFTANCVIFDECMVLDDAAMAALAPTTDAVANSQLWYLGSAGIGAPSVQLGRLRKRSEKALETGSPDPTLAYFEWSIDPHVKECSQGCDQHDEVDSVESLLKANPAVGYRLEVEKSLNRRLTLGDALYARERLGVGEYPSEDGDAWSVIGKDLWDALTDGDSQAEDPLTFSIDTTPERSHTSICMAGRNGSVVHVEVIENRPGTQWVIDRARELHERWSPRCWVIDPSSPAGSFIKELEETLDIEVVTPRARDVAQATGQFYDAVVSQQLVHIGQAPLSVALAGARKRDLGEAWAWARRGVGVDISPLVGVTLARWGLSAEIEEKPEEVEPWVAFD